MLEETDTETKPVTDMETEPSPRGEPGGETEEKRYLCSHCGAEVVPQRVETPSGVTNRCPQCGKFMRALTPQEVREREEEAGEPLPPLEVLATNRVKELLVNELPRVYGIPKKDAAKTITAIIDTLTPPAAMNPWNLHSHVKDFASNANDRHLESIINKIFYQLEEEGYLPRDQGYQPRYGERRESRGEGQPRYGWREREPRASSIDRGGRGMKVVVDGQEIETDYEGYMAYQRFKREEAEERRRAEEHELRMKRLEAEILKITGETGAPRAPQEPYEEVREFVDDKGNLCDPEKAVSVRIKRMPIGTKEGLTAEEVRRIMREEREALTPEKVREIIRSEKPEEESPAVKELKRRLDETKKDYEGLKTKMESEERAKLVGTINKLEDRIEDLRGEVGKGEYHEDTFRMLDSSIRELASIIKNRKPLDVVRDIFAPPAMSPTIPPSEMAGEAERGGVIQELRKHGLVTRVVERRATEKPPY